MKTGNLRVLGDLQAGVFQLVERYEVTGSAVTSKTFNNLLGNTDEEYILRARFVNGYSGTTAVHVRLNNDSGANYGFQYISSQLSTTAASRSTSANQLSYIGYGTALGNISHSEMFLYAKSGYVRTAIIDLNYDIVTTTANTLLVLSESWNNISDEITSLVVLATQNGGIGVGSVIELFKKVSRGTS